MAPEVLSLGYLGALLTGKDALSGWFLITGVTWTPSRQFLITVVTWTVLLLCKLVLQTSQLKEKDRKSEGMPIGPWWCLSLSGALLSYA